MCGLDGAIDVCEAGKNRFPDEEDNFAGLMADLIASAQEAGDDSSLEKLRSLGYL